LDSAVERRSRPRRGHVAGRSAEASTETGAKALLAEARAEAWLAAAAAGGEKDGECRHEEVEEVGVFHCYWIWSFEEIFDLPLYININFN
jgi:hypothetical protein